MAASQPRQTDTCAYCSGEAYTVTRDGTLVCQAHDPEPSTDYTCDRDRCDQPLHPDSDDRCVLHLDE